VIRAAFYVLSHQEVRGRTASTQPDSRVTASIYQSKFAVSSTPMKWNAGVRLRFTYLLVLRHKH
jgi:hypothetical protein